LASPRLKRAEDPEEGVSPEDIPVDIPEDSLEVRNYKSFVRNIGTPRRRVQVVSFVYDNIFLKITRAVERTRDLLILIHFLIIQQLSHSGYQKNKKFGSYMWVVRSNPARV
jgi:hypothetical protein